MKNFSNSASLAIRQNLKLPSYSKAEELLNALTHGIGIVIAIIGTFFLFKTAPLNFKFITCYSVYVATLFLLYIVSTIYHALPLKKIKSIFRKFDHCSIFFFIAGTYTPINILLIKSQGGLAVLATVWAFAVLGVILNLIDVNKFAKFSLISYLAMGWLSLITIKPLIKNLSPFQMSMLFIGGGAYTFGALIYVLGKRIKFMHSVWHLFVLAGSIFHFILVYSSCSC